MSGKRLQTRQTGRDHAENSKDAAGGRRPYRSPRLTVWGSIQELTGGLLNPPQDFPFVGGSTPT